MVIGHSRQQNNLKELREIEVNLKKIGRVTKTKYLGLNIDDNLSRKDQYEKVKTKAKSGLSAIRKLYVRYSFQVKASCSLPSIGRESS